VRHTHAARYVESGIQKLEALTYICVADSIGVCLLLFTQLSLKPEPSDSKTASRKTEFYSTWYSHSRSF